jgi:hypothetical protein
MDSLKKHFRLQFAAAVHFENFTGYDIDRGICELLTDGAAKSSALLQRLAMSSTSLRAHSACGKPRRLAWCFHWAMTSGN